MQIKIPSILLCLLLVCACEKLDTNLDDSNAAQPDRPTLTVSDILNGDFESDTEIWLTGYIVGYVNGSSMSSTKFVTGEKATNIILADSPLETSYKNCVPVQLSGTSAEKENVRNALNLSSNPGNLKHKVKVLGTISKYMSTNGIIKTRRYEFLEDDFDYETYYKEHQNTENADDDSGNTDSSDEDNQFDDDENDDWPADDETTDDGTDNNNETDNGGTDNNETDNNGTDNNGTDNNGTDNSGTETSLDILSKTQFTISEITGPVTIAMQQENITTMSYCKVKGYIVGYISGNNISSAQFTSVGAKETNIVLADSPHETDYTKCIAVQLSTGSSYIETRRALNLKSNPNNLGRLVTLMGTLEKYMGRLGLKNTSSYVFIEH